MLGAPPEETKLLVCCAADGKPEEESECVRRSGAAAASGDREHCRSAQRCPVSVLATEIQPGGSAMRARTKLPKAESSTMRTNLPGDSFAMESLELTAFPAETPVLCVIT
mmetsp:Transcript_19015/g.53485  ORF Transcript_19015/g.53485 Transcript_19015/m.53485 type:complete len:110 (-) Transcript_19015:200-529(-)